MKEIRYTKYDLETMPKRQFEEIGLCFQANAFRLLGVFYKEYLRIFWDVANDALVIQYE